jgi:exopolysaccharide biosynthesis polyprenyl glycosylphosphotransferase
VLRSTRVEGRTLPAAARRAAARTRRLSAWTKACLAVDALMLFAAVVVADLGAQRAGVPTTPTIWLVAFPLLTFALMAARGLYRPRVFLRVLDDLRVVVTATALAAMIVLSLRIVVADDPWVAAQTARIWAFASVYLLAGRIVLSWGELQARRRGESVRPTLVVGAGHVGRLTANRLLEHPELGLRPIGFLDKEPRDAGNKDADLPVLGASWDLDRVIADHGVKHVVMTFSTAPGPVLLRVLKRCQELGVEVSMVPRFYEKVVGHIGIEYLGGLPLLTAQPTNPRSWQFAVKYAADRLVAALLLVLVSPVLLIAGAAVWITMGRPVFFRQTRAGRDGRTFEILKFRSMRLSGEKAGSAELRPGTAPGGVEGVDRRTRVGAFLRRTSIDELPQLWNVLKGEMSLVGPRPERPEYVDLFTGQIDRYGERHRVKAGITGWAQVHGLRGQTSLADRVEWDNYYIENWSLWLDVKILLLTVLAIVRPVQAE